MIEKLALKVSRATNVYSVAAKSSTVIEQSVWLHFKTASNTCDIVDRDIALRPLDPAKIGAIDPTFMGQGFLAKPTRSAKAAHVSCQNVSERTFVSLFHKDDFRSLPLSDVIVDGRDFLYTVFQLGSDRARPAVERLFGSAILRYVDRAWATDKHDQEQRISICHLAVQDDEVVRAHARNATVIGGRYDTEFCSAFMVRIGDFAFSTPKAHGSDSEAGAPWSFRVIDASGPKAP